MFLQRAPLGDLLDGVAVAIARRKIHGGINLRRVRPQRLLDQAVGLDEFTPIVRAQKAQTGDAVAHGDLVRRLRLTFGLDQSFGRLSVFGQTVLEPAVREREVRALALQVPGQFAQKRSRQRRIRARHVGQNQHQVARVSFDDFDHSLGPVVGQIAIPTPGRQARGDPAQILDQGQSQHDRDGPQLAQMQGMGGFVRGDEAVQTVQIDAAIDVRDQFQRDGVGARVTGVRAAREPRKFAAVRARQVSARQPNLIFDQIEIVQQPFRRRRDAPVANDGGGHQVVRLDQDAFVFIQAGDELIGTSPVGKLV